MVQKTQEPQSAPALVADLTPSNPREFSCKITAALIKYLESHGYDTDALLKDLPYTKEYLIDPFSWISFEARETLCQRAVELTHNEAIMYDVGCLSMEMNSMGGVEQLVKLLGDPKLAYRNAGKFGATFDLVVKFQTTIIGANTALIEMSLVEGYAPSKHGCYFTKGVITAVPTLWGLPRAHVIERQCMCPTAHIAPEDVNIPKGPVCSYEVTWHPLPPLPRRFWDGIMRRNSNASATLKKLEDNFIALDKRNAELTAKNRQLAKVREIALAIDGISTREQVYMTVVELARDIPGVRLVFILKEDETGEYMVSPYHSKLRQKSLVAH